MSILRYQSRISKHAKKDPHAAPPRKGFNTSPWRSTAVRPGTPPSLVEDMSAPELSSAMNFGSTKTYNIPVDHLEYSFIEKCTDVKHLENILQILRSGEEGHYPNLIDFCEKRIESLAPQSRALRKDKLPASAADFSCEEWRDIQNDLKNWLTEINAEKQQESVIQLSSENALPIRSYSSDASGDKYTNKENESMKSKTPRDYRDWDRFDVEKELSKLEENSEEKAVSLSVKKSTSNIEKVIKTEGLSPEQRCFIAEHEKDKGNEAFRSGDYEEAVTYYSRSISVLPSTAAYNNRAQAEIKLENWHNAMNDCQKVLDTEPGNLKALLRRATVYKNLCNYQSAAEDLKIVLHQEPGNPSAKKTLDEINELLQNTEHIAPRKGKRMIIQDIEGSDEENEDKILNSVKGSEIIKILTKHHSCNFLVETGMTVGGETAVKLTEMGNAQKKFSPKKNCHTSEACSSPKHSKTGTQNGLQKSSNHGDQAKKESKENGNQKHTAESGAEIRHKDVSGEVRPSLVNLPLAARLKAEGNQLFKNGQFGEAAVKYSEAIESINNMGESAEELGVLYSNRAACHLKDGDCRECIEDCNQSLELQPFSIKPLLRRAMANESLERYRQAYVDYKTVLQIDSGVQVAHDSINRITRTLMDQDGTTWREKLPPIPVVPVSIQLERQKGMSVASSNVQPINSSENKSPQNVTGETALETFLSLKKKGNDYVQKGQYSEAVKQYTECLKINSEECALYTNRALCYLKLSQYEEARQDCECALQREASNIKALYRRAQAYRGLENYQACATDLQKVISIDPTISEAKKQLDEITPFLSAGHEKQRKKILIEEEDEDEKTNKYSEATNSNNLGPSNGHENVTLSTTSRTPLTKPTNAYEFSQLINRIRADQDLATCAELLAITDPKDLPAFLSNKLEGDILLLIVRSLKHSFLDKDPLLSYRHLSYLSKAERFKVVLMLLSNNEKIEIRSIFESLSEKQIDGLDSDDIWNLAKDYEL
ncbi:sperm-associated antigen 1 [Bombina bombina]|uniref:sperm-associated antigen 1 n=1 Tax=Bombina bombina TaxID=8345 RepID=UPI00235A8781|nr:sperm-associated antigen 1 [Bombina bombina]